MAFNPNDHLRSLKGKQYLDVAWRLVWLREDCPEATITTEMTTLDLTLMLAVFRAEVALPSGAKATGYGSETEKDFPLGWIEKAETKAVGRALAALGFGTQFAAELLDDDERLADSPQQKRPVPKQQAPQSQQKQQSSSQSVGEASSGSASPAVGVLTSAPTRQQAADRLAKACMGLGLSINVPLKSADYALLAERYGVSAPASAKDLTIDYLTALAEIVESETYRADYEKQLSAIADSGDLTALQQIEWHVNNQYNHLRQLTSADYEALTEAIGTLKDALTPVEGEGAGDDDALAAFLAPAEMVEA